MTLYKQLLFLISIIFLIIFSVNFITSVTNIRDYLEVESKIHAQDTATSLGLALSPHIIDETDPILETMMNAIFDRGFYQEIKLVNVDQVALVTLKNENTFEQVPDWFVQLLPMNTAIAMSEVNSGWSIGGELFVTINPGYGYLKLYQQARNALNYSFATFLVAIALLFMLLRFILHPLKKIENQARTIAKGHFITVEPLPWTIEVRNVAVAMNYMSKKIAATISKLNSKLQTINQQLQRDELTGLYQKNTFITDLKQHFIANTEGHVVYIKIDNLSTLAEQYGHQQVDQFIIDFATVLKDISLTNTEHKTTVYRFYGSEFALIVISTDQNMLNELAVDLSRHIAELGKQFHMEDLAHIGIAPFNHFSSTKTVMSSCQEAYQKARLIGKNSFAFNQRDSNAISSEEWNKRVRQIIDHQEYEVVFINHAENIQLPGSIVMSEAFTQVTDEHHRPIPTGTFISIAEKLGKAVEFDRKITECVIQHMLDNSIEHAITINLSMQSVRSSAFHSWLTSTLDKHPQLTEYLTFSLTAYAANKDIENFKNFIKITHQAGAKILLKRYESQLITLESIKEFNLDYIRLAQDLTSGISSNADKLSFLETLQAMAELLDINILAEQIASDADFDAVKATGIFAASR
jgi:diguanylate cyclase (GGDEF)-like protein